MAYQALGALLRAVGFFAFAVCLFFVIVWKGGGGSWNDVAMPALYCGLGLAAGLLGTYLKKLGGANPDGTPLDAKPGEEQGYGTHWGAFFLTWIWAFGNGLWLEGFAALFWSIIVGFLRLGWLFSLPPMIAFAWKGYAWARKAKTWRDEEHFLKVQRVWTYAGVGVAILGIAAGIWASSRGGA